jgi:hypothetical protein
MRVSLVYYTLKIKRSDISTGIKPGQAITYLRETTTTPLQSYDIYNLIASFKREQRHGLSANDALIQHLKDKGIQLQNLLQLKIGLVTSLLPIHNRFSLHEPIKTLY